MGRFNDEIPNINLLDTKTPTVHGHTKIELYNPNTKIKNVVESDNTFQSTVGQKLMSAYGQMQLYNSDSSDNYRRPNGAVCFNYLFGGLMLFRDSIAVGTKYMPKSNKMVGLGYKDKTNGTYPMSLGSFNAVESSASINGITYVYDFATNQANGMIGCVCLTHRKGAEIGGYGYPDIDRPTGDSANWYTHDSSTTLSQPDGVTYNDRCMLIGNKIYGFNWNKNAGTFTRYIKHLWTLNVSLKTGYTESRVFDVSDDVATLSGIASLTTGNRETVFYLGDNKIAVPCWYHSASSISPGSKYYYYVYDCSNDSLTLKSITNTSNVSLNVGSSEYFMFGGQGEVFTEQYNASQNRLIFDTETSTHIKTITLSSSSTYIQQVSKFLDRTVFYSNGLTLTGGRSGYGWWIYNRDADTLLPVNASTGSWRYNILADETTDMMYERGYETGYAADVNPLMLLTINNLNSPVTKTAAQTMKVTYTLTES